MKKKSVVSQLTEQFVSPFSRALDTVQGLISDQEDDNQEQILKSNMLQLFTIVLKADGDVSQVEREAISALMRDLYGEQSAAQLLKTLDEKDLPSIQDVCSNLRVLSPKKRQALLQALFITAFSDNKFCLEEQECLHQIATELELSEDIFEQEQQAALLHHNQRLKILNSSTGLIASVVVIGIFVLAATFLKSVLFGLVLAYFFLPIQQKFQHSFLHNGWAAKLTKAFHFIFIQVFLTIIHKVQDVFRTQKKDRSKVLSEEEKIEVAIKRSSNATVFSVSLSIVVICSSLVLATVVKSKDIDQFSVQEQVVDYVQKMETWPIVGESVKTISKTLSDPTEWGKIPENIMKKASEDEETKRSLMEGAHATATIVFSALSTIGHLFLNMFMSLFFFSFFLGKMASYQEEQGVDLKEGDYLVQSLFKSSWLPTTSTETLKSAADLINDICDMLKTWVRGYIWIILIESPIYILLFLMLGVPYAIILGVIAGLTVLLPFLGPIISFALTCGACLLTGMVDPMLYVYILCIYFVLHSVLEQLFLYPAFVGESLGLNVLETLIVVLLGGVFSGITGMIFAVPVASVLKILIPRVYRSYFQFAKLQKPLKTL